MCLFYKVVSTFGIRARLKRDFRECLRVKHARKRESEMGDLQVIGGIKKLNNQNYNTWSTCMMSYMQGQDLWEVVNGSEITQPEVEDANGILRKWKIKAGKAMFALKTTIEEDVLEHI